MKPMSPIRIFHTLWTKPLKEERTPVTLLCYAISFHYAKQMGAEVALHTDTLGAEMLSFIPYDEVIIDLDNIPERITRFWAYGKLYATKQEPLGSVHIDGDVFLKNPSLAEYFCANHDLLTQSEEGDNWRTDYTYELSQAAIGIKDIPNGLDLFYPRSYNCGVVQFNNAELKKKYLDTYFKTVELSLSDPTYENRIAKIIDRFGDKGSIIPDIITEQQFLHEIAQEYITDTILTGDIRTDALSKGYTHLCTAAKYEMKQDIERMLGELDQKLLNKVKHSKFYK